MKTLINDYCLRLFTGSDNGRPALTKISLEGEYLYATNGHMAAKVKASQCVHPYEKVEKYPDCQKAYDQHESTEKKTVSADLLFNELVKIECCFKPKMIDCKQCGGDGTCECDHCDSTYKCKHCKGEGAVPGTELELSGENRCLLFNRQYNLGFLDRIIRTMVFTGVKEIEISNGAGQMHGTVFTVGDFTILLMPMYQAD